MKRMLGLAGFVTAVAVAVVATTSSLEAQAPSEAEYMKHMQAIGAAMGVIRKSMEGDPGMAAKSAMSLEAPLKATLAFWEAEKAMDAITDSKTALTAAANLSQALQGSNTDAAGAALKTLGGTCQSCHKAHREQLPDKTYRIIR